MARGKFLEGCQHEVYGVKCLQPIKGQGAKKYCSKCRDEAQKEDKRKSNEKSNAERKATEGFDEDNRYSRLISHYGLTNPKLEPLLINAETRPEECHHKDDFCKYAENERSGIIQLIIHPSADLPSSAYYARKKLKKLHTSVEERQRDFGHDSMITQLKLSIMELDRDIGMWNSGRAFTTISGKAKKIQKLMHQHNELYGFIHALLARVEIFRVKYFATCQGQFLVEAHRWLNYAEDVCDQALKRRLTDERKQMALYLRLYIELIKVRLAFDSREEGQVEQAGKLLKEVDKRAAAVEDAYGGGQVVATASFVTSITHTEYDLRRRNLDSSANRLKNVVKILPTMGCQSIESTHRVACLKTALALENNDPESPEALHNYISVFGRNPCYEYLDGLRRLKGTYPNQLTHVNLPEDRRKFVDTTFTHILPHLRYL